MTSAIEQILLDLESTGFSLRPGLIPSADLAALAAFVDDHRTEFRPAKVGTGPGRKLAEGLRGDETYWLDPLAPPEPFTGVFSFLELLRTSVNERFYLGLKQYECHLACYPPGAAYGLHLDRFNSDSSRSLSFVFYLNQSWETAQGGELVLYGPGGVERARISPTPGTFVCFLSADFPHEVRPARRERRSLTGWMHTKLIN